jgi:predicted translin family RNA/ssDNA-binding protein
VSIPDESLITADRRDAFDVCQQQRDELLAIVREVAAFSLWLTETPTRDLIERARVAVAKAEGDQP